MRKACLVASVAAVAVAAPTPCIAACTGIAPPCSNCETLRCLTTDNTWECAAKPAGTACVDGNPCTFNATCDGTGICVGTPGPCPPATFAPVQCAACPTMTEVNWSYNVGGRSSVWEQPQDPNCVPTPTSPCPHYINNIRLSGREIVGNQYISQFGFRVDFFKTDSSSDRLSWVLWQNGSETWSPSWVLSGSPPTGWVDTAVNGSLQASPIVLKFDTDASGTDEGFALGRAHVCCSTTPSTASASEYRRATPFHGVLLGTNDVVFLAAHSWGQVYHSTVVLEGDQALGNRYYLFVKCNAQPAPTVYDYVSYANSTQQSIHLPLNYCSYGALQIAVYSSAGSGSFKLVVTDHYASEHYRLRVGSDYAISATDLPTWSRTLSLGAQSFFGVTEGTQYIEAFDLWNGTGCGNCGGINCDICIRNQPGTGICCNATGQIELYQDYRTLPRGVAHELGHRQLHSNIPDEYAVGSDCPAGVSPCYRDGHTVMANPFGTNHNLCQINDHNTDGTPGVGSAPNELTSAWTKYSASGFAPYQIVETAYQGDYQDFDFGGQLGTVVIH